MKASSTSKFLMSLFAILLCSLALHGQTWETNGNNVPFANEGQSPLIRYSEYNDHFYILSQNPWDTTDVNLDSLSLNGTTWGSYNDTVHAKSFVVEDSGGFTFLEIENGNFKLINEDQNGQVIWSSTSSGLPLATFYNTIVSMFRGINDDYYITYNGYPIMGIYKYQGGTWTDLGMYAPHMEFLSNGNPVIVDTVINTTPGSEGNAFRFHQYNGVSWDMLDSVTILDSVPAFDFNFCIDAQDSLFLMYGRAQVLEAYEIYAVNSNSAFIYQPPITTGIWGITGHGKIIVDKLDRLHVFYHWCDGFAVNYLAHSTQGVQYGIFQGEAWQEIITDYSLVVDEINCINIAYSYLNYTADSILISTNKFCDCEYLDVQNTITDQGFSLHSNITEHSTYQWLDCANNFSAIAGATDSVFTIMSNGFYALETTRHGCIDTTECIAIEYWGINEIENGDISLYPNPTSDQIQVQLNSKEKLSLQVSDLSGKLMFEDEMVNNNEVYSLDQLAPGSYLFKFIGENGAKVYPVVKL